MSKHFSISHFKDENTQCFINSQQQLQKTDFRSFFCFSFYFPTRADIMQENPIEHVANRKYKLSRKKD